jgi:hypothetical protein
MPVSVSNKSNARGRWYEKADVRLNALLERRRDLRSILRSTESNAEAWIISYQEKVLTAVTLYGISKKQDTYAGEPLA